MVHLGAVPVPAPRSRAHTNPALGASQGRQLLSLHATGRCFPAQTFRGISNAYLTFCIQIECSRRLCLLLCSSNCYMA